MYMVSIRCNCSFDYTAQSILPGIPDWGGCGWTTRWCTWVVDFKLIKVGVYLMVHDGKCMGYIANI